MLGLSGRDGGSDEESVASKAEVDIEGIEFVVELGAAEAARAVILWSVRGFGHEESLSLPAEPPRSQGLGGDTVVMLC